MSNQVSPRSVFYAGLTKRELFAAMAMAGWVSGISNADWMDEYNDDSEAFRQHQIAVAMAAVGYADALIAELEKTAP